MKSLVELFFFFFEVCNSYFLIKENKYIIVPKTILISFSGYAHISKCLNTKMLHYHINVQLNWLHKAIAKLCQLLKRLNVSHANKVHSKLWSGIKSSLSLLVMNHWNISISSLAAGYIKTSWLTSIN